MFRGLTAAFVAGLCFVPPWLVRTAPLAEVRGAPGLLLWADGGSVALTKRAAQKPPGRKTPPAPAFTDYRLPAGTVVPVTIVTTVRSASSSSGDQVDAKLTEAIARDGHELLPAGSMMRGTVVDALAASPREPRGRIAVAFFVIEHLRTGSRATIKTATIAVDALPSADKRPADVELTAGQPLNVVLARPLLVRIPK